MRERALGRRCPRRHGPLARLRLGRLGRAPFLAPAGPVYLANTPYVLERYLGKTTPYAGIGDALRFVWKNRAR